MRRSDREITDKKEIMNIFAGSKVLHLGLVDDGMPYVVPMNFGYEEIDGQLYIYMHGAVEGRKLDIIRKNPNCCFEMECKVEEFEGNLPCQYGTAFESVMGNGKAEILESPEDKMHALSVLMKTQTAKDFEFNEKLVSVVSVLRIVVSDYTAKRRPNPKKARETV